MSEDVEEAKDDLAEVVDFLKDPQSYLNKTRPQDTPQQGASA